MNRKFIIFLKRQDWASSNLQRRYALSTGFEIYCILWIVSKNESHHSCYILMVDQQHIFILQDDRRISAKCRDAKVEDLWSLTSFFGYSTQTFVLAVNLLDRFLAMMRVRNTHINWTTHSTFIFICPVVTWLFMKLKFKAILLVSSDLFTSSHVTALHIFYCLIKFNTS